MNARTEPGSELGDIARFFSVVFPYIDSNCKYQVTDLFAVDIGFILKKMSRLNWTMAISLHQRRLFHLGLIP